MKYDFIVLGATGMQGIIATKDLLESGYKVLACGRDPIKLKQIIKNVNYKYLDVRNKEQIIKIIKESGAKILLNCVELKYNLGIMKICLELNINYLDLGGLQEMTKEQYKLQNKYKNTIALLGCGSTPGIANVMAKYAVEQMNNVDHIDLGFGWNSNIKEFVIPYSIESIIYELTTEPVVLENGKFIKSKVCYYEGERKLKEVGKQNIYCIVHSEIYSFTKYFKKKGIKKIHYTAGFPEHSHKVLKFLIDLGFGSTEKIKIKDTEIKIIDFTREILKKNKQPKDYIEIENVWVECIGEKKILMECITKTKKGYEFAGSNINTGMTISIMAQLLYKKLINKIGVIAPEDCVPCNEFFEELKKREIKVFENGRRIN